MFTSGTRFMWYTSYINNYWIIKYWIEKKFELYWNKNNSLKSMKNQYLRRNRTKLQGSINSDFFINEVSKDFIAIMDKIILVAMACFW